jgi:hypothetical protein
MSSRESEMTIVKIELTREEARRLRMALWTFNRDYPGELYPSVMEKVNDALIASLSEDDEGE